MFYYVDPLVNNQRKLNGFGGFLGTLNQMVVVCQAECQALIGFVSESVTYSYGWNFQLVILDHQSVLHGQLSGLAVETTSWKCCPPLKQSSVDHRDSRKFSKEAAPASAAKGKRKTAKMTRDHFSVLSSDQYYEYLSENSSDLGHFVFLF